MSTPYPADFVALQELLDALNDEQRRLLLEHYCRYCGANTLEIPCDCDDDDNDERNEGMGRDE